jgi:hypothetical protein
LRGSEFVESEERVSHGRHRALGYAVLGDTHPDVTDLNVNVRWQIKRHDHAAVGAR